MWKTLVRGTRVTLDTDELQWCHEVGRRRTINNRNAGVKDQRYSKASGPVIDRQGVIGEYALAKMLDRVPYQEIDVEGRNNYALIDSFDLLGCIDVKAVRGERVYPLLVTSKKRVKPAPWYASVSIHNCPSYYEVPSVGPCEVIFEGAATGVDVFQNENKLSDGKKYQVTHDKLRPLVLQGSQFLIGAKYPDQGPFAA